MAKYTRPENLPIFPIGSGYPNSEDSRSFGNSRHFPNGSDVRNSEIFRLVPMIKIPKIPGMCPIELDLFDKHVMCVLHRSCSESKPCEFDKHKKPSFWRNLRAIKEAMTFKFLLLLTFAILPVHLPDQTDDYELTTRCSFH